MPFKMIKGTFHVVSYSPDGDSIRFKPDDPQLVRSLPGGFAKFNARGHCQLRIEAIDTLETHFGAGGATLHQPLALAHDAAAALMRFVGITDVAWDEGRRTVVSAADGTRGYILSRSIEKNGRPVSFVFAGEAEEKDGDSIVLRADRLRDSYNHAALVEGLAYPTYYEELFHDLRDALTQATAGARTAGRGIWAADRTTAGFDVSGLKDITDTNVILPKLFRRLSEYMVSVGTAAGFKQKLAISAEPVLDLRTDNFTHLDTFVEETAQGGGAVRIAMTRQPEELVFDPMPRRPVDAFAAIVSGEQPSAPEAFPLSDALVARLAEAIRAAGETARAGASGD